MFKKGDYIVLIKNGRCSSTHKYIISFLDSFRKDHIYKIREKANYMLTELDSRGGKRNGWSAFNYIDDNWRYATSTEIILYNYNNKPVSSKNIKSVDNFSII